MFRSLKTNPAQCALPRKVSNLVLQLVERNGKAFFQAYKARVEAPDRFLGPGCIAVCDILHFPTPPDSHILTVDEG